MFLQNMVRSSLLIDIETYIWKSLIHFAEMTYVSPLRFARLNDISYQFDTFKVDQPPRVQKSSNANMHTYPIIPLDNVVKKEMLPFVAKLVNSYENLILSYPQAAFYPSNMLDPENKQYVIIKMYYAQMEVFISNPKVNFTKKSKKLRTLVI